MKNQPTNGAEVGTISNSATHAIYNRAFKHTGKPQGWQLCSLEYAQYIKDNPERFGATEVVLMAPAAGQPAAPAAPAAASWVMPDPVAAQSRYGERAWVLCSPEHDEEAKKNKIAWGLPKYQTRALYTEAQMQAAFDAGRATIGAVNDVIAERNRQITAEGWRPEHDDEHTDGQLAGAAACYARHTNTRGWVIGTDLESSYATERTPNDWPWSENWWKPTNPRRDLIKAAALILAEIERLDRASIERHHKIGGAQ